MAKFTFTESEKNRVLSSYNVSFAQYGINPSKENVFSDTYGIVIDILKSADTTRLDSADKTVLAWVTGAKEVNGGSGFFKDFIREYTIYQHITRYYGTLRRPDPVALAQEASNGVAKKFFNDIVGRFSGASSSWTLPSIDETGFNDAGAAASTVFYGEYAPWAGTLLFPYLGYDRYFNQWLLAGGPKSDHGKTVVIQEGTYNLVAAVRSGYEAGIKAGFANIFDALKNAFLSATGQPPAGALDADQADLVQAANEYFRATYGLETSTAFRPGDVLVLNGSGFLGGANYTFGSVLDDVGEHKIVVGDSTRVVNSGAGNDLIETTPYSQDNIHDVLVDASVGKDTLILGGSNVTLQFDDKGMWGWRGLAGFSSPLMNFFNSPPADAASGVKRYDIYNVENFVLSPYDDKVIGTDKIALDRAGSITIDASAGDDNIVIKGGIHITTIGGAGRDFIYNHSVGGIIYGDTVDGLDPETHQSIKEEVKADDGAKTGAWHKFSDTFQWAPGVKIMDAGRNDHLTFYGVPLVGGNTAGGISMLALGGAAAGMASVAVGAAQGQDYSAVNSFYWDELNAFIMYKYVPVKNAAYNFIGGELLVINVFDQLSNMLGDGIPNPDKGVMRIENFNFLYSYDGALLKNNDNSLGTLGMAFKKANPIWAILAKLPDTAISVAGTGGGNAFGPLIDELFTEGNLHV